MKVEKMKISSYIFFCAVTSVIGVLMILFSGKSSESLLYEFHLWSWMSLNFSLSIFIDWISLMFMGVVCLISGSVLMYSVWYMNDELFFSRFIKLILGFVGSMYLLIFIPNLVILLIGWDGLGLTSFLLVCYYQNNKALSSGMITTLTNRLGDVLILACISFMINEGSFVLYMMKSCMFNYFFLMCLILGSMTKSAQMPFCAWLPAAMAAPTPVSSLVHSSTLVTAGVYLLIRSYYFLSKSGELLMMLKCLSIITLLLAGSSAVFCLDMKKIIALSTLSQLSVMMYSLSCGMIFLSFFHLVIHAVFKALLFLSAGVVIHSCKSNQDIRILGGCWSLLPMSMSFMFISNLSLCGFPFISGFFSKDMIIDSSYSMSDSFFTFVIFIFGMMFTGLYSFRMMWMTLFSLNKSFLSVSATKESMLLLLSYMFLGFGSLFFGVLMKEKMEKLCGYSSSGMMEILFLIFMSVIGFCSMYFTDMGLILKSISSMLIGLWFMEALTSYGFSKLFMYSSFFLNKYLDKGYLEVVGPQGLYSSLIKLSVMNEKAQSFYFLKTLSCWTFFVFSFFVLMFLIF
nr:NADH dehydrogenase subunit 5 [Vignadula atrata]